MSGLLCLLTVSCKNTVNPCVQSLVKRDNELARQADSLIRNRGEMTPEAYRAAFEILHTEEKRLFLDVDNCDFGEDMSAYNYWYRGRLKFPGKIEQEWQFLVRDSTNK